MNRRAKGCTSSGADRSTAARSRSHSATCVVRSSSMRSRRRAPVPRYTATKLRPRATAVTRAIASASWARSPPGSSRLAMRRAQAIADVADRLDRGPAVVLAELAAQVADVDLQHLRARVEVEPPHRVEDLFAREHLIRVTHQVGEQLELARRELHLAPVALHAASAQVDSHAAGLEHRGLALTGRPQLRAHPG